MTGMLSAIGVAAALLLTGCTGGDTTTSDSGTEAGGEAVSTAVSTTATSAANEAPTNTAADDATQSKSYAVDMAVPDDADLAAVHMLDNMDQSNQWQPAGDIAVSISTTATQGAGSLKLEGSGELRLKPQAFAGLNVGDYDRIVMDVQIIDGHVTDIGMVTQGFPQTADVKYPRWAKFDESTPSGQWIEWSADLSLYEWPGGNEKMVDEARPALSLVYVPGKNNTGILIDNVRLIKDPVRLGYDWIDPVSPLIIKQRTPAAIYERPVRVENTSSENTHVAVRFSGDSMQKFKGSVSPASFTLKPGETKTAIATIEIPAGTPALTYELQTIEIIPNSDPRLIQRQPLMTAAPFPKVKHPFTIDPAKIKAPRDADAILSMLPNPVVLPAHPSRWISQSTINTYFHWKTGNEGYSFAGFDRLKNNATGEIIEKDDKTGPVFHRWYVAKAAPTLAAAYQTTKDEKYAQAVRDIALAYAREYHKYELTQPVNEASSYLSPNNATYTLGTVMMSPITGALDLVWESKAFTDEVKQEINHGFLMPAVLEMQKINPGMTNMQDAMSNAMFNIGLLVNDPNIVAHTLWGDHGLNAKINAVFDEDGGTPESVSPGYHNAALSPVLAQVESLKNAGLQVDLAFDRLEKAKTLMGKLAMPDGRIPNRGDSGFPAGRSAPPAELGSVSFPSYGVTVLREGEGKDGLYIAMDHRPPALTHSHKDKLAITLYGQGEYLGVDEGSLYNTDATKQQGDTDWGVRSAWGTETLVHNTITVDEESQSFGGGHRIYYHGVKGEYQAVAAYTDNVYEGVVLERNIVMLDGVIVMVDRAMSDRPRTYDWTHHSFGDLSVTPSSIMKSVAKLGGHSPYDKPANPQWGDASSQVEYIWKRDNASLRMISLPQSGVATQAGSAIGWANKAYQQARMPAPFAIVRRKTDKATFVTVFEPFKKRSKITAVETIPVRAGGKTVIPDDAVAVHLTTTDGSLTFLVSFTEGVKTAGPIQTAERCFAMKQ